MHTDLHPHLRRILSVAAAGLLAVALSSCTARGGGQLPPVGVLFTGPASFGFSFSCEDKGGLNTSAGKLHIQLSYTERGTNPIGSPFAIHGTADVIDSVLESAICIGQDPPPGGNELIFLGRYRLTSSAPAGFVEGCAKSDFEATSCRFEVIVKDNDGNLAPSTGDYFQIKLSSATGPIALPPSPGDGEPDLSQSQLPTTTVFYTRAGVLSSGNITVE